MYSPLTIQLLMYPYLLWFVFSLNGFLWFSLKRIPFSWDCLCVLYTRYLLNLLFISCNLTISLEKQNYCSLSGRTLDCCVVYYLIILALGYQNELKKISYRYNNKPNIRWCVYGHLMCPRTHMFIWPSLQLSFVIYKPTCSDDDDDDDDSGLDWFHSMICWWLLSSKTCNLYFPW